MFLNVEKIGKQLKEIKASIYSERRDIQQFNQGAQIILFPECSITVCWFGKRHSYFKV